MLRFSVKPNGHLYQSLQHASFLDCIACLLERLQRTSFLDICIIWLLEQHQHASFLDRCISGLFERLQRASFLDIISWLLEWLQRASLLDMCISRLFERRQRGSFLDIFTTELFQRLQRASFTWFGLLSWQVWTSKDLSSVPIVGSCNVKCQGVSCVSIQKFL